MSFAANIKHLCTQDFHGGAAKSAYRIHRGLLRRGLQSQMLVRDKLTNDASVIRVRPTTGAELDFFENRDHKISKEVNGIEGVFDGHYFKSDWGRESPCLSRLTKDADIVHVHWVSNNFLDYSDFFSRPDHAKPIIWRLPDMNPITGGCHFSGDCDGYKIQCGHCPAIGSEQGDDLSRAVFNRKLAALTGYQGRIEFVASNDWMRQIVQSSAIGQHFPVHRVYNSVDTNLFAPTDRKTAKTDIGLDASRTTILFTAFNLSAPRKGLETLINSLAAVDPESYQLALVGGNTPDLPETFPTHFAGTIDDPAMLANYYQAADIVVVPSLSDNLPNVVLEALAAGCCVVASDLAGIPELVQHEHTGLLFQAGNSKALAETLKALIASPSLRKNLSTQARQFSEKALALAVETDQYMKLYDAVLEQA